MKKAKGNKINGKDKQKKRVELKHKNQQTKKQISGSQ